MSENIRINVVYLGGSRGQTGCAEETVHLPKGSTVADASAHIAERHPALAPLLPQVRWAKNFEFAREQDELADGDELGVLPPVCGGAPSALVTDAPLDVGAVMTHVVDPAAGATVLFVGTVRNHARGKSVRSLSYEIYPPMTQRKLEQIAQSCEQAHQARVFIAHRHGTLQVGDISVVIATSAAHREEAYQANCLALERIKEDAPIWKKEISDDGSEWVGWGGG